MVIWKIKRTRITPPPMGLDEPYHLMYQSKVWRNEVPYRFTSRLYTCWLSGRVPTATLIVQSAIPTRNAIVITARNSPEPKHQILITARCPVCGSSDVDYDDEFESTDCAVCSAYWHGYTESKNPFNGALTKTQPEK